MALPNKFDGSPAKVCSFLNMCENYFILNPMTQEQQVHFALALTEGKADHWMHTSLNACNSIDPPAWENSWLLFKRYFNLCFKDCQERDQAVYELVNGKNTQTM
jgi:hypothetical protein